MENLIDRVKNIIVTPKTEWLKIDAENSPHVKVCTTYVALLALIPAVASLIGYWLIGSHGVHIFKWGLYHAVLQYLLMVGGTYVTAYVIDALAPNYGAQKSLDKAYSLVAYAYTPTMVGGIFYLIPALSSLASIAALYSLYLLYIGLQPMMKQPADKTTSYFVVSLLVFLVAFVVVSLVLGAILGLLLIGSASAYSFF
ncbi:MAG: YIP1 family protein [Dysgonamonadaceae bacterium]|jgi:hypothetical protein|nr:YIP1 family protein [Dysgonamonadaceae bacterium]